ncbi:MAG: C40 family peptidase [Prevotella sp.]|nr:C40 family peptidase [Prevotella sp.]MCM1075617.1 C40 family peptidase [Ruminococcus sp.]
MINKLKNIFLSAAVVLTTTIGATAQNPSHNNAHQKAHRQHQTYIAKATTPADRARINNHINNEVMAREELGALSAESNAMLDDLLKEARKHMGKKYVHGSKGPNTFDCSGFSSYVYKQFGYKISPASRAQYTEGVPVARRDLRKGDLVFFTSRSSGNNVGHVGIVVSNDKATGKVEFIHASIKGVRISEIEGYYNNRYVGARRIITD